MAPGRLTRLLAPLRTTKAGRVGVRVVIAVVGLAVVAVGLVLVPLPGPGWLIVFAGVAVWSLEFDWADRLQRYGRRQVGRWARWLARQGWPVRIAIGVATAICAAAVIALGLWASFGPGVFQRLGTLW